MFDFLRNLFKSSDQIVYIRFTRDKVSFDYYPSDVHYEDEPILAVKKKGSKIIVSAVGKEIYDLNPEDTSVAHTPFKPFLPEPDSFDLGVKVIRYLMKKGATFEGTLGSPRVIIHPDKTYVSEVEEDAYRELALSAGAREVVVYVGEKLQADELEGIMQSK